MDKTNEEIERLGKEIIEIRDKIIEIARSPMNKEKYEELQELKKRNRANGEELERIVREEEEKEANEDLPPSMLDDIANLKKREFFSLAEERLCQMLREDMRRAIEKQEKEELESKKKRWNEILGGPNVTFVRKIGLVQFVIGVGILEEKSEDPMMQYRGDRIKNGYALYYQGMSGVDIKDPHPNVQKTRIEWTENPFEAKIYNSMEAASFICNSLKVQIDMQKNE
jgi:hypothetical protein